MLWKILESFTSFVKTGNSSNCIGSSNYVTDNCYNEFINSACSIIDQMRLIFFGIVQGFP